MNSQTPPARSVAPQSMSGAAAAAMFLCFAFAYFFSALVRAVVATLAPVFSSELSLTSADLGLLAGAYFLGFACMQLPLGSALDRIGPKRVLLGFLSLAVIGCVLFALARSFAGLTAARALIGMGVSACLMAPMTCYRRRFSPRAQLRAASWMLMTGSIGMVASTLPVQWLLAAAGLARPVLAARGAVRPRDGGDCVAGAARRASHAAARSDAADRAGWWLSRGVPASELHPLLPMGFFHYGGLMALQSLWIGPWLSRVCGWSPQEAAQGLFALNVGMLLTFLGWGALVPRLYARGWTAQSLIARGLPLSLAMLVLAVALGARATAAVWTLFCVSSTLVSLAQPAIGQAFPSALAGRALSAYNLVIFAGVFVLQWMIGGTIDAAERCRMERASLPFRARSALVALSCIASYLWFLWFDDVGVRPAAIEARARSADNPRSCRES